MFSASSLGCNVRLRLATVAAGIEPHHAQHGNEFVQDRLSARIVSQADIPMFRLVPKDSDGAAKGRTGFFGLYDRDVYRLAGEDRVVPGIIGIRIPAEDL